MRSAMPFAAENEPFPLRRKGEVLCLTDALFAAVCDTENPQGILAVCKKLDWDADAVPCEKNALSPSGGRAE